MKPKPCDHRRYFWAIGTFASILWCSKCGAWRPNAEGRQKWYKPTGDGKKKKGGA